MVVTNHGVIPCSLAYIPVKAIGKSLNFEQAFGNDFLIEKFDRRSVKYLLDNWQEYATRFINYEVDDEKDYDPRVILDSYLKKSKGLDYNEVKYKKSGKSKTEGRWFAEKSLSIQNMPRVIRHTICKDIWIDIDFKNCHPVILEHLCIYYHIECDFLHKYNCNREIMLNEIIEHTSCFRDDAKKYVLKTLNGSNININVSWWNNLKKEFENIATVIASQKEFKKIKKSCTDVKHDNLNARVMNHVLCIYENMMLQQLYQFFVENGIITGNMCCLIFDGLQVLKTPHNVIKLTPDFLKDASEYIYKNTGLYLELDIKPFDEFINVPDDYIFNDTFFIENGDDVSAAEYILNIHSDKLKKCNGDVYIYNDGVWSNNEKIVDDVLTYLISKEDIRKIIISGSAPYSRCAQSIKNCKKMILASDQYTDNNFVQKIFESNLYYLAFNDGIWSFKENKFLYHPIQDREIYFTTKINRDFPKYDNIYTDGEIKFGLEKAIELVYEKIINPILPEEKQRTYFLHCIARALAGHYEDKKWYVGQGLRDCGKGVLCLMLKLAFGGYVAVVKSENFLVKRLGDGDNAKKASWLIPLEFVRLAISNELSFIINVSKMDGNIIKSFASGGDLTQARQNYKDEREFQLQATLMAMCNDFPKVEPTDAYETLEVFLFLNKFVDVSLIVEGCPDFYQAKDENVKGWCKNQFVIDAFTMIILDHYQGKRLKPDVSIMKDIEIFKNEEDVPLEKILIKYFKHSNDENDRMHVDDMVNYINSHGYEFTSNKVTPMMKMLKIGVQGRFRLNGHNKQGFTNIKTTS